MSKPFVRVYTVVNEFLDAGDSSVTVGSVGDAKLFAGGVEDFAGSRVHRGTVPVCTLRLYG